MRMWIDSIWMFLQIQHQIASPFWENSPTQLQNLQRTHLWLLNSWHPENMPFLKPTKTEKVVSPTALVEGSIFISGNHCVVFLKELASQKNAGKEPLELYPGLLKIMHLTKKTLLMYQQKTISMAANGFLPRKILQPSLVKLHFLFTYILPPTKITYRHI